jgi:hypothetical protein
MSPDSIYVYKSMLVAIGRAFDLEAIDRLLFLDMCPVDYVIVSGDGLLEFARLIASRLARATMKANNNWNLVTYAINITEKGKMMIDAWRSGDRNRLSSALIENDIPKISPEANKTTATETDRG